MDRLVPLFLFGFAVAFGCGENLSVESTETNTDEIQHKNSSFQIVADSSCIQPCMVTVSGLPNQLVRGIKYYVDGAALDLNENWWMSYEQTLPATAVGYVTIEAEALNLAGYVIASTSTSIQVPSNASTGFSATVETRSSNSSHDSVRLKNDSRCSNPCSLRADVTGQIDKVEFYAGPYYLGQAGQSSNYTISYQFSQTGAREIRVAGVTWGGTLKAEHRSLITIEDASSSNYSTSSSSSNGGSYNAYVGNSIADAAYGIATRRNTVGYCYSAAADAIESVTGPFLWGGSAYLAADQLRASPWFYEASASNLRSLPAGAVVVWGKGSSPHGHISIALGNGQEASDHVATQMTYHYGGAPARVFYPQ